MQQGYIKLYRCVLDNSWSRQPDFMAVWVYCLLRGSYKASDVVTKGGSIVHLEPGQFITSREQISIQTGVQESKVERILKVFKSEQQIEQISKGKYRIISITNWQKYQAREQDDEQQTNNKRTTDEQQLNTDKKVKKEEEGKEETTTATRTRSEEIFATVFEEKEARVRELFPHADFEAEKETCIAYYKPYPPPSDAWVLVLKWFQRIPKSPPPNGGVSPPRRNKGMTAEQLKAWEES